MKFAMQSCLINHRLTNMIVSFFLFIDNFSSFPPSKLFYCVVSRAVDERRKSLLFDSISAFINYGFIILNFPIFHLDHNLSLFVSSTFFLRSLRIFFSCLFSISGTIDSYVAKSTKERNHSWFKIKNRFLPAFSFFMAVNIDPRRLKVRKKSARKLVFHENKEAWMNFLCCGGNEKR